MADTTPWKWNYFTLESISKVKCSLCDSVRKPLLKTSQALKQHLADKQEDDKHKAAFHEVIRMQKKKEFSWDSHYETVFSDIMFKPYVKCNYCKVFIPMSSDNKPFIQAPTNLSEHLKNAHKIEYSNWQVLESWIYGRTRRRDSNTGQLLTNQVIKVDTCAVCNVEIGVKNAIMFVKHLIKEHRDDQELNFPWDIIPKELHPSDVTVREDTTLSSDIADRQVPSSDIANRQGSSGVFTESIQFSSKRKKEVLKEMSEPAVSTQIKEPPYKRRKSSSTDDSE